MALILGGFIVFGQSFIKLWAGNEYSESFLITLIFFIALYIPLIQNIGITILQARNQMTFRSLLYVTIAIISLIFQIILSKSYGALGCAIAIGAALILGTGIIMNIYYYTRQDINIPRFWSENLKQLIAPAILTIIGYTTNRFFDYSQIPTLALGITLFTIIYIASAWFFSMNSYERNLFSSPLKKILSRPSSRQ